MAPKNKKNKETDVTTDIGAKDIKTKNKSNKGILRKVMIIIVILLILCGLVGIIYSNAFNIRDKYLVGLLQKIPIVNNLVTISQDEDIDEINNLSIPELKQRIKKLEADNELKEARMSDLMAQQSLTMEEMERLQNIEAQQNDFKEQRKQFNKEVVSADPSLFIKLYEDMVKSSGEDLPELYKEAVEDMTRVQEMKRYVATFQTMDESSAAKILEELITTDIDLVVLILKNVGNEIRAGIMSSMSPENGARVTKMMVP